MRPSGGCDEHRRTAADLRGLIREILERQPSGRKTGAGDPKATAITDPRKDRGEKLLSSSSAVSYTQPLHGSFSPLWGALGQFSVYSCTNFYFPERTKRMPRLTRWGTLGMVVALLLCLLAVTLYANNPYDQIRYSGANCTMTAGCSACGGSENNRCGKTQRYCGFMCQGDTKPHLQCMQDDACGK